MGPYILWLGVYDLEWHRFSSGVKIKPVDVKIDSSLVELSVTVTAGKSFHLLNFAVDTSSRGIGYSVSAIGYVIFPNETSSFWRPWNWGHPGMCGPEIPATELSPHPSFSMITP